MVGFAAWFALALTLSGSSGVRDPQHDALPEVVALTGHASSQVEWHHLDPAGWDSLLRELHQAALSVYALERPLTVDETDEWFLLLIELDRVARLFDGLALHRPFFVCSGPTPYSWYGLQAAWLAREDAERLSLIGDDARAGLEVLIARLDELEVELAPEPPRMLPVPRPVPRCREFTLTRDGVSRVLLVDENGLPCDGHATPSLESTPCSGADYYR
jgi:hypothetical protein